MADRPNWTSRLTFILASIGSAVGLGNIWRFPYVMGQNGGAVFLMIYLLLIFTICFIPLFSELRIGQLTKKECIGAYESISPKLKLFGFLNPLTGILISSFYFIVGGWILKYILSSFANEHILNFDVYFNNFVSNPLSSCIYTIIFLLSCIMFSARGIKKGIEFANNILMPVFGIILICLTIFSLNLPNAHLGLEYMFKADFSKLNAQMFLSALGQALFTLSIGMGALVTYGSYINEDKNLVKSTYMIILADTFFALMAGIMIFPAIFSYGLEPSSGAGLVFITLPQIFSNMPCGNIISVAFFVLLFAAAITSGISIIEVPIASMVERMKLSRKKACYWLFLIISSLAIPASLSFGIMEDVHILGKNIFNFLDFITSNALMPFNALFLSILAGWAFKIDGKDFIKNRIGAFMFNICLKFIVPAVLIALLYIGLK